MVDKLLTLEEAAKELCLSSDELRRLVNDGKISAYQIGGVYLRFKKDQVDLLKTRYKRAEPDSTGRKGAGGDLAADTFASRIIDFLYSNDFYILSVILIAGMLFIVIRSMK